jgi:hypothetical protein
MSNRPPTPTAPGTLPPKKSAASNENEGDVKHRHGQSGKFKAPPGVTKQPTKTAPSAKPTPGGGEGV